MRIIAGLAGALGIAIMLALAPSSWNRSLKVLEAQEVSALKARETPTHAWVEESGPSGNAMQPPPLAALLKSPQTRARRAREPVLARTLPAPSVLSEETRADAHSTPPSLKAFARELESHVEEAERDPEQATRLFHELADCATGKLPEARATTSLRVHCFRQARRLADAHFEKLDAKARDLEGRLDERTRLILRAMAR